MNAKIPLIIVSIVFTSLFLNLSTAMGASSESLLQQGINANKDDNRATEAIKLLDSALQQDPNLVEGYLERGKARSMLQKYKEAIEDYNRALQYNPNLVEAYIYRGKAKQFSEQYQAAMKDFDRAIELNPKSLSAYFSRGMLYRTYLKQKERGDKDFDLALTIMPESIDDYPSLGLIFHFRKNPKAGIEYFNKAINLKYKNSHWAYVQKAVIYQYSSLAKPDLAILNYKKFFQSENELINRHKAIVLERMASNYLSLDNYSESIANSNESLRLDPKNDSSLSTRGKAFYYLKNYPAALTDFNRAIAIDPKSSSLHGWRADTYYMLANYKRAISEYDRAIELSPSSAYLYKDRGHAKFCLSQSAAALADYQKAVQLARKDGDSKLVKSLNDRIEDIQNQPQRMVLGSIMALFLTGSGFAGLLAISRRNESVYLRQFREDC
jgi:tetratricopeptide (TPR) repeat protein